MDRFPLVNQNEIKNPGKLEKSNAKGRFSEMVTESNLVYHTRFTPSIDSYKFDQKEFLNSLLDVMYQLTLTIFFQI